MSKQEYIIVSKIGFDSHSGYHVVFSRKILNLRLIQSTHNVTHRTSTVTSIPLKTEHTLRHCEPLGYQLVGS